MQTPTPITDSQAYTIRKLCNVQNISLTELASRLNITPQNLNNKLTLDNFKLTELQKIANALDLSLNVQFENTEK